MPEVDRRRFSSRRAYRDYQQKVAREALAPVLERAGVRVAGKRLLEVGCGSGGMTAVWSALGARAVGLDIDADRLEGLEGKFITGDVAALPFEDESFDVVIAHDCLEHVRDLPAALAEIRRVLAGEGAAFVSFPPFMSPYGGHQQGSRSWVKFLPYGHLLPSALWVRMSRREEYRKMFAGLSRLTMGRFEKAAADAGLSVAESIAFIVRPEVALRTRLPRITAGFLARVPVVREFAVGGAFYILEKQHKESP